MQTKIALAGCIVCDEQGGVLMLHRKTNRHNHWEVPGGKLQLDETAQAAAVRELQEELGVQVSITRELGSREFTEGDRLFDYTWFLAEITHGEPRLQELDLFDKWGYFSLVTLTQRYDELSPGAKSLLEAMAYGEIDLDI